MLKDFQIECLVKYGNAIVSKKYEPQKIVDECARYGLKVRVREFVTWVDQTHYIVEVTKK